MIVTKGYGSNHIITKGYGFGFWRLVWREILRAYSRITAKITGNSPLDLE